MNSRVTYTHAYARVSEDGRYRYALGRRWADGDNCVRFIMLNPSTADATVDDPTIRRCISFARSWGYGALQVLNLYALRATNPRDLWSADDPVGPENNTYLRAAAHDRRNRNVVAWGANARDDRVQWFREVFRDEVFCLGRTKFGAPRHPLYVGGSTRLEPWS